MAAPTWQEAKAYLGTNIGTTSDADVVSALAAERTAQARVCKASIIAAMPDDIREALLRRVARNLAMKALPLGVLSDESGGTSLGSNDPEIRRLEKPHRKVISG